MRGELERLETTWEAGAKRDPHWVVLTDPSKRARGWDDESFFATGGVDADRLMSRVRELGRPTRCDLAMDFGCGLGRISRALCEHFPSVDGVDISATMVQRATELHASRSGLRFHLNVAADLSAFETGAYDLVHSVITLQHMPPSMALAYMAEFIRLLAPGGVAAFQMPAGLKWTPGGVLRRFTPRALKRLSWRARGVEPIEMHTAPFAHVEAVLRNAGGRLLARLPDDSAGPDYHSHFYFAGRV